MLTIPARRPDPHLLGGRQRRGNTLVLVTAILVLLVIIATAFISRTQDGRKLAAVQGHASQREESASIYADQLAAELTRALFPAQVNPIEQAYAYGYGDPTESIPGHLAWREDILAEVTPGVNLSELLAERTLTGVPRASDTEPWLQQFTDDSGSYEYLDNQINIERFGADLGDFYGIDDLGNLTDQPDGLRDLNPDFIPPGFSNTDSGFTPLFDFNFAPYETRPWTNWPDDTQFVLQVPHGLGAKDTLNGTRLRHGLPGQLVLPLGTGNPRGNPGFGDSRWLRDSEPRRLGPYYDGDDFENNDPRTLNERFTHWTHLSWIPTAENGWRVCYDISNVARFNPAAYTDGDDPTGQSYVEPPQYDSGPTAGYTLDTTADAWEFGGGQRPYHDAAFPVALQTPYEQWYPNVIPQQILEFDDFDPEVFIEQRDRWFSSPLTHFNGAMRQSIDDNAADVRMTPLPNYIDLTLLGSEKDRYRAGTPRNVVERTYADTDGDGFTDSFWFLSPHSPSPGVKQVVGVSVVDNSGMLNANVATVFDRWTTSGETPADAALVSRLRRDGVYGTDIEDDADTWMGLLVDPKNTVKDGSFFPAAIGDLEIRQRFDRERWFATPDAPGSSRSFLNERGLDLLISQAGEDGPFYGQYRSVLGDELEDGVRERKLWNTAVQSDFNGKWVSEGGNDASVADDQLLPFTARPFGYEDELELRSFAGLNHPTRFSRLEGAMGNHVTDPDNGLSNSILRGDLERPETSYVRTNSPFGLPKSGKNNNLQQVRDIRHRMTLFSGARNEFRPLWLWKSRLFEPSLDYDRDQYTFNQGDLNDFNAYEALKKKIDLRATFEDPATLNGAGAVGGDLWLENRDRWLRDLQDLITISTTQEALFTDPDTGSRSYRQQSYLSDPAWSLQANVAPLQVAYMKTLQMAASYAANIEAYRDGPLPYVFDDLVTRYPDPNGGANDPKPLHLDPPLHPRWALGAPNVDRYGRVTNTVDLDGDGLIDDAANDLFIGMEKQPFITQAFYGLIYPRTLVNRVGDGGGQFGWEESDEVPTFVRPNGLEGDFGPVTGEKFVDADSQPALLLAIQIANPFDEPVSLYDFALQIGNRNVPFKVLPCADTVEAGASGTNAVSPFGPGYYHDDLYLGPALPDAPRTAIVFALVPPNNLGYTNFAGANPDALVDGDNPNTISRRSGFQVDYDTFRLACLDYLDLEPGDLFGYEEDMSLDQHQTLVFDASKFLAPSGLTDSGRENLLGLNQASRTEEHEPLIQLVRIVEGETGFSAGSNFPYHPLTPRRIVLDRIQHKRTNSDDITRDRELVDSVFSDFFTEAAPPAAGNEFFTGDPEATRLQWQGIRLGDDDFYMTWAGISRFWGWDVDFSGIYDLDELSPRYVFSVTKDPLVSWEEGGEELDVLGSPPPSPGEEAPVDYRARLLEGTVFSVANLFEPAIGDTASIDLTDEWIKRFSYTAPLRDPDLDPVSRATAEQFTSNYAPRLNLWDPSRAPAPWTLRGKPFNFPTWTVIDSQPNLGNGGIANGALYDRGFPLVLFGNDGNQLTKTVERVNDPDGNPLGPDSTLRYIPMDLVVKGQDEYAQGFREDLWNQPLQMLLKDDDFEQIGELNQVFLWGPVIDGSSYNPLDSAFTRLRTKRTFAELMTEVVTHQRPSMRTLLPDLDPNSVGQQDPNASFNVPEWWGLASGTLPLPPDSYPVGTGVFANRLDFSSGRLPRVVSDGGGLKIDPGTPWRAVLGANLDTPAYQPLLPAGAGIFDGVTIDGRGVRFSDADYDGNGFVSDYELIQAEQDNANLARGFSGEPTRGLININTASPEVLRTLPQMSRLIYNDYFDFNHGDFDYNKIQRSARGVPAAGFNFMHLRFAEAMEKYRLGDSLLRQTDSFTLNDWVPSYADRGYTGRDNYSAFDFEELPGGDFLGFYPGMRNDAGFVSLGELLAMDRTQSEEQRGFNGVDFKNFQAYFDLGAEGDDGTQDWRLKSASVRSLGLDPYGRYGEDSSQDNSETYRSFGYGASQDLEARERYALGYRGERFEEFDHVTPTAQESWDARLSTDRNTERRSLVWLKGPQDGSNQSTLYAPDMVGGDAEEANLLFSGMANLLTTRSDVFTVYFTIRSFKQDPISGFWDATDEELVIDESRYVMVVDRSTVDGPTDQPRVIAFTKVE